MKNKKLLFGGIALILGILFVLTPFVMLFGFGSLVAIARSGGQQPTPVVFESSFTTTGYQPVQIDQVEVQVGTGSPIPVQ